MTRSRAVRFDGGDPPLIGSMLRWLLLGVLLFGMGTGLNRGWLRVDWALMVQELGLPAFLAPPPEPADSPARQSL